MSVRNVPAIVLSLVLGAAALAWAPLAHAGDGGDVADVQTDRDSCGGSETPTRARLKVGRLEDNELRLLVIGTVWSEDSGPWEWKLRHNGEVSDDGRSRGAEDSIVSLRVSRSMFDGFGTDDIVFRAENIRTGEVCRAVVNY